MAKKSKKSKTAATDGVELAPSTGEPQSSAKPAIPGTSVRSKISSARTALRAKSAGKRPGISTRKAAPSEKPKKVASRKKSAQAAATLSDEDIRLRAYLISEWRMQNGVAGDSTHDWVEARRQLQEEAARRA